MKENIFFFLLMVCHICCFQNKGSYVQKLYDDLSKSKTTTESSILRSSMINIEKIYKSLTPSEQAAFKAYVLARGFSMRTNNSVRDNIGRLPVMRFVPERIISKMEGMNIPTSYINLVLQKVMNQHKGMRLEHIKKLIHCEIACMPTGECLDPCFHNLCC